MLGVLFRIGNVERSAQVRDVEGSETRRNSGISEPSRQRYQVHLAVEDFHLAIAEIGGIEQRTFGARGGREPFVDCACRGAVRHDDRGLAGRAVPTRDHTLLTGEDETRRCGAEYESRGVVDNDPRGGPRAECGGPALPGGWRYDVRSGHTDSQVVVFVVDV